MEMTFDTSFFGWILAAGFGLYMVYRHIMQRMTDMKRALQQDIREAYDSWKSDMEFTHQRAARLHDRVDALEMACNCKPKDSKTYYNTEA